MAHIFPFLICQCRPNMVWLYKGSLVWLQYYLKIFHNNINNNYINHKWYNKYVNDRLAQFFCWRQKFMKLQCRPAFTFHMLPHLLLLLFISNLCLACMSFSFGSVSWNMWVNDWSHRAYKNFTPYNYPRKPYRIYYVNSIVNLCKLLILFVQDKRYAKLR